MSPTARQVVVAVSCTVLIFGVPILLVANAGDVGYGLGLFLYAPFATATAAALFSSLGRTPSMRRAMVTACTVNGLLVLAFLGFALEGLICILMTLPLLGVATVVGAATGFVLQSCLGGDGPRVVIGVALVALSPVVTGAEATMQSELAMRKVKTSIVVQAPIQRVWECVIEFPEIESPPEWYFTKGIAYPIRARIVGRGVGAIRYCEFSTGAFVEPITEWNEPVRLAFDVSQSPAPLEEWNPWATFIGWDVHPPHLSHTLDSRRGQFDLEDLGGGRTRLTGTTWYTVDLAPVSYWEMWSDAIIHRIHLRVLEHIGRVAATP